MASWIRLDTAYLTHPKLLRCDVQAVVLHLASLLYLREHDIGDGVLPPEGLPYVLARARVRRPDPVIAQLVSAQLWHPSIDPPGFVVHNYRHRNGDLSPAAKDRARQADYRSRRDGDA